MQILTSLISCVFLCSLSVEENRSNPNADEEIIAQFLEPIVIDWKIEVKSVNNDGTIQAMTKSRLTEGYVLGRKETDAEASTTFRKIRLFRFKIDEVKANSTLILKIGKEAIPYLTSGDRMILFRPRNFSTASMKKIPATVAVEMSNVEQLSNKSTENLGTLGYFLFTYMQDHGRLPPAVIYGPNGKPWHSWRVLLLPYLDHKKLYNQYRFDEPWNGPNNKKLLSQMPDVFRDPSDKNKNDFYTNYAAATGKDTLFPSEGLKLKKGGLGTWTSVSGKKGNSIVDYFVEESIKSVMLGSVKTEMKIPWMKPQDIPIPKNVSKLGAKNFFSAPYKIGTGKSGLFLLSDSSVLMISDKIDTNTLNRLFRRNKKKKWTKPDLSKFTRKKTNAIEIYRDKSGYHARYIYMKDDE